MSLDQNILLKLENSIIPSFPKIVDSYLKNNTWVILSKQREKLPPRNQSKETRLPRLNYHDESFIRHLELDYILEFKSKSFDLAIGKCYKFTISGFLCL